MGLDYDKYKKQQEEGDNFWASYADLYTALSVVFLLLYVVASFRSGTSGFVQMTEKRQLQQQVEDLKEQLRVYDTLRDDYMRTSSEQEQEMYEKLMGKLDVLQDEANEEAKSLREQAKQNEDKKLALNKYQQMVRNVVNTNLLQKSRIQMRDKTIVQQTQEITQKAKEVRSLQKDISQKERELARGQTEIAQLETQLESRKEELDEALKKQKITKAQYQQRISKITKETTKQIKELEEKTYEVSQELTSASSQLQEATAQIEKQNKEREQLVTEIQQSKGRYQQQMEDLKAQFEEERSQQRAQFEKELSAQKLSAAGKAKKLKEFEQQAKAQEQALKEQISGLAQKIQKTEKDLGKAKSEQAKLSQDLDRIRETEKLRKEVIENIKGNFAKAGISADVDPRSGDVILSFGDEYFDTGNAALKPKMKEILKQFMPIYSKSLLDDPKIAQKVQNVEIVGFASPTYQGRFVDPNSLNPGDKKAVDYNLDLSYNRAKSIFNYIFDTKKMEYQHQKNLLPLVKVTGRSFFSENDKKRDVSNVDASNFCQVYDCKKAQRVIIKFNLKN